MNEPPVNCPNCPNQGWYEVQGTTSGCCNQPTATGECCGCPIPVPTLEQEQCQFCWLTPNSVFNQCRYMAAIRGLYGYACIRSAADCLVSAQGSDRDCAYMGICGTGAAMIHNLYVYDRITLRRIATVTGDSPEDCDRKAWALWAGDQYGWSTVLGDWVKTDWVNKRTSGAAI